MKMNRSLCFGKGVDVFHTPQSEVHPKRHPESRNNESGHRSATKTSACSNNDESRNDPFPQKILSRLETANGSGSIHERTVLTNASFQFLLGVDEAKRDSIVLKEPEASQKKSIVPSEFVVLDVWA